MLLIARGNFNLERFSANASPFHAVPVLRTANSSAGTVALLDASTPILGEIAEVHATIDRRGFRRCGGGGDGHAGGGRLPGFEGALSLDRLFQLCFGDRQGQFDGPTILVDVELG